MDESENKQLRAREKLSPMVNRYHHRLLSVLAPLFFAAAVSGQISKKVQCQEAPLDVIFLVDTNARNAADFEAQQNKIADIVRHLERISVGRDTLYSVVAFHRRPVILLSIASPFASKTEKVLEHVNLLRARSKFDSSPAKALDLAAQQFISNGRTVSDRLVILAHDGVSTDLIAETLEARNSLVHLGAAIFAITSTDRPNLPALTGYTMDRTHVFATASDRDVFFEELERAIGACIHFLESSSGNDISNSSNERLRALGVRTREVGTAKEKQESSFEGNCKANKIDLMLVLDTSGSVFNAFAEERKLARDLIESLDPSVFKDGRLQDKDNFLDKMAVTAVVCNYLAVPALMLPETSVCVIRFSSSAEVKIPFKIGQNPDEVVEKLEEIRFTGGNTPIARAVDLGLAELSRSRRRDAIQVFVLITDGNGQEPWHVVQMAGKKLQSADAEVFAVSTSRDYNLDELTLYTGDEKHVYVGPQHNEFIGMIAPLMSKCMHASPPQLQPKIPTSTVSKLKVLQIDSTSSSKTTVGTTKQASIEIKETFLDIGKATTAKVSSDSESVAGSASRPTDKPESTAASERTAGGASLAATEQTNESSRASGNLATSRKPATQVAPAVIGGNSDLAALADSFEELDSSTDIRITNRQNATKAKGSPSVVVDGSVSKKVTLDKDLKTELTVNKVVDKQQSAAQVAVLPPRTTIAGNLDLLFAIDRSSDQPSDLTNQLKLATELVDELTDEDIDSERVRVAIISFAHDARMDLEWGNATTKGQIFQHLASIEYTTGDTSAVAGVKFATQYAEIARRPNTRLMIILISDGNSQDVWHTVTETAKKLHQLPNTIIYAVTTSKQYKFLELEAFTGDKWKVYVDGRTRRFVADAGKQLIKGTNETGEFTTDASTATTSSFLPDATVAYPNDPLDLVILLDQSTTADSDFEKSKKVLEELLRSIPVSQYKSLVRVGFITFTDKAHTEIDLRKPTSRDDVLYAIDRSQNKGDGVTSIPTALNAALMQINAPSGDTQKRRRVFVILTDGSSHDPTHAVNATVTRLQKTGVEVFVVPITDNYSKDELLLYCGDRCRLITNIKGNEKKFASYLHLNGSKSVKKTFDKRVEGKRLFSEAVPIRTTTFDEQTDATNKPDLGVNAAAVNEIDTSFNSDFDFPTSETARPGDPNCRVDLMFVMDKSQSVEDAFQKQLQFAVTLVKRIPASDFNNRIRVAAISFNSRAQIEFQFDEFNNRSEILHALLSIKHTGGSTSAVSGVNLAVAEILKTGRKGARRMIVLISDGNSQDRWEELLDAADRLRATDVIVYSVTASHNYYFRELELYAGSKWLVYVDARKQRFLEDAELSLLQCQSPSIPEGHVLSSFSTLDNESQLGGLIGRTTESTSAPECRNNLLDLLFIIDTSTSVDSDFQNQKAFALDLIKVIPLENFQNRITVAVVQFNDTARVLLEFGKQRTRGDILYELERIERTGGRTSLVAGVHTALLEVAASRRPSSRLIIVIISDGNSQDLWPLVQKSAVKLRKTGAEIYAVTLSEDHNVAELKEYAGDLKHVYTGNRVDRFIEDVGGAILNCSSALSSNSNRKIPITFAPSEEVHVTPAPESVLSATAHRDGTVARQGNRVTEGNEVAVRGTVASRLLNSNDLARDEKPVVPAARDSKQKESHKCKYSKMDLEIILDASTSRQQVFEHQRELALSLIERLPIDAGETHVAVGINSFTSVPTLRQTLGLGRDKQMVRHAIEDIKYNGGSTFTAQAVELSIQDLEHGRRPDAIQVVVLMNDGMSQDPWEKVLEASQRLQATGAELFGVALGEKIDLRELRHYIGSDDRIYRDNSTERFLTDVVSLLTGGPNCGIPTSVNLPETKAPLAASISDDICNNPNLDIVILFDNADQTANQSDPSVSSNRYLLLDVLGSLPVSEDSERVKIAVITFNSGPQLVVGLSDKQDRDSVFKKVESIEAEATGKPSSYAKAVNFAVQEYNSGSRLNARGMLVIVGDGRSEDSDQERENAAQQLHSVKALNTYAVDSGKRMDVESLTQYTGTPDNVFNYDRNAEFAKIVLGATVAPDKARCPQVTTSAGRFTAVRQRDSGRRKDVASKLDIDLKQFEGEKVVVKDETITTVKVRTPRPTTKSPKITIPSRRKVTKAESSSEIGATTVEGEAVVAERRSEVVNDLEKSQITSPRPTLGTRETTPTRANLHRQSEVTSTTTPGSTTVFTPGCEIDAVIIIDSSGSVEATFDREKELATGIINRLRIGPNNARVAIIKFAAKEKVKTVWSFDRPQEQHKVLQALQEISFSSGTTAIHTALLQAITEYSSTKGARPGQATPFGIIFTDGFGQKDTTEAAVLLRNLIPNMYAVAVNRQYPISIPELERIAGSRDRVFTDENIDKLYRSLEKIARTC